MSSMFKKKGGLAFKPKVPVGKARPAAPPRPSQPSKPVASQISPEPASEEPDANARENAGVEEVTDRAPAPVPSEPQEAISPTPAPSARQDSVQAEPSEKPQQAARADLDQSNEEERTESPTVEARTEPASSVQREVEPSSAPATDPTLELPQELIESVPEVLDGSNVVDDAGAGAVEPPPTTKQPAKAKPRAKRAAAAPKKLSTGEATEDAAAAQRPTRKRTRPVAEATEGGENAAEEPEPAPRARRKRRAVEVGDEASQGEGSTPRARSRRARSITPEDAETQIVDLQQIKMSDLTRDLRIGKKFSRHDELRERERQKKIKAKLQKQGVDVADEENGEQTPDGGSNSGRNDSSSKSQDAPAAAGPQFRIVDGQIVVDQTSLVMDRHARAAADQEDMELIEENDFSRQITSNSYMSSSKLRKGNNWSEADTELFYRGLRMFGTDFEMISQMFKNKVRREVKLKFNREERNNPKLIDAVLMGEKSVKMDIDEYKQLTSSTFESVESIEAEQRKIEEDFEAERKRIADEQAEVMRKKREALFADDKGGEDGGDENGQPAKKKKKKNKKQQAQEQGLYGDEEVALD